MQGLSGRVLKRVLYQERTKLVLKAALMPKNKAEKVAAKEGKTRLKPFPSNSVPEKSTRIFRRLQNYATFSMVKFTLLIQSSITKLVKK